MKYNGPERLRSVTESVIRNTGERYGINFLRTNTPVEVSLSHHGISYEDLGFSSKKEYFEKIDSLADEFIHLSRMLESVSDEDKEIHYNKIISDWKTFGNGPSAKLYIEAKKRGEIPRQIEETEEIGKTSDLNLISSYSQWRDVLYFDPLTIIHIDPSIEGDTMHELTHNETGNCKMFREFRRCQKKSLEYLQRVFHGEIKFREHTLKAHLRAYNIYDKSINIGSRNISESVAFAAEKSNDIPNYENIDEKEFLKCRKIFSRLFNKYPYSVVIQMAKDVLDISYDNGIYATHVLEEMAKEKESNDFDYNKLLWL